MKVVLEKSNYKDIESVVFLNGHFAATFLPGQGAKMASFKELSNRKEYLTQRESAKCRVQKYDGNYLAGENSGFDVMFPTVSQCH